MLFYRWISREPRILIHAAPDVGNDTVSPNLPPGRVYRFVIYQRFVTADDVVGVHREAIANRPGDVVFHLVNSRRIVSRLQSLGLPVHHVNHNAFVDDETYLVDDTPKEFEAVYVARMHPEKRHELAAGLRSLLLVGCQSSPGRDPDFYWHTVARSLPNAVFLNASSNKWVPHHECAAQMRRATVGLCLSEYEGAMYVASEYQLCGLPVVTTGSHGGRSEFFDARYSRVVPPEPTAVARAVRELADMRISPHDVRAAQLAVLRAHRLRFCELVQRVFDNEFCQHDFLRWFHASFVDKLGAWRDETKIVEALAADKPLVGW